MYEFDKESYTDAQRKGFADKLDGFCEVCNSMELTIQKLERDVNNMKFAEFMMKFIGSKFKGIISAVTNFGIFVELPNTIQGFIGIKQLPEDFYRYDDKMNRLTGERGGKIFTLGMPVEVECVAADKATSKIEFKLV